MDENNEGRPQRQTLVEIYQINALQERELALKNRDTSLKYGSPGTVHYNVEEGRWEFSRCMVPGRLLEAIGDLQVPIPSPVEASRTSLPSSNFDPRNKSDLISTHPEAALAAEILAQDESISNEISSAASHYDPALSSRLTFGYAATPQRIGANAYHAKAPGVIPIIAIVGGGRGEKVRLVVPKKIEFGWTLRSGTNLRIPEIHRNESWWLGGRAPVQQIKVPQPRERKYNLLVVQSAASTTILRPVYNRHPVRISPAPGHETNDMQPPSRLDPNPVAIITSTMTGGDVHADASFNPWYPQQIAIIDRRMKWSIWDVEGKPPANLAAGPTGNLCTDGYNDYEKPEIDPVDGWASVCWIAVDKLVVCNRRMLALYDIADEAVKLPTRGLDLLLESEWILEVKNDPVNQSDIFVLTSARILWLRVGLNEADEEGIERVARGQTILSWRHFRAADDVSLSLCILLEDTCYLILIYSRLNSLVLIYRLNIPSSEAYNPVSLFDPAQLMLGIGPASNTSELHRVTRISTVTIQKLDYLSRSEATSSQRPWDFGLVYRSAGVEFYKVTVLFSDLSVREQLYAARAIPTSSIEQPSRILEIEPPLVRKEINRRIGTFNPGLSAVRISIDDDFVTQEDEDIFLANASLVRSRDTNGRLPSGSAVGPRDWTVDYESLYNAISEPETLEFQGRSFVSYVEEIRKGLNSNEEGLRTLSTPYELLGKNLLVSEIAKLATPHVQDLIDSESDPSLRLLTDKLVTIGLRKMWLRLPSSIHSTGGQHAEMNGHGASLYNCLVRRWQAHVLEDASKAARDRKELILKRIASEISLASVSLAPDTSSFKPDAWNRARLDSKGHLPVRGKDGLLKFKERDHGQGNALRPLSPEPVPLRESQDSIFSDEESACSRLRAYTTVKSIPPLPKKMATILAHWSLDEDPHSYNWGRMETELAKPAEDESQEQKQTKLRRRKEGLVEHTSRFAFVSDERAPVKRVFGTPQSQGQIRPPVLVSSQVLASSQAVDEPMASTQTERGLFGGRDALGKQAQKARKKRQSGF